MSYFNSHHNNPGQDRYLLWVLLGLLIYTPLPLASNRPWAFVLMATLMGVMLLWRVWRSDVQEFGFRWQVNKIPLTLLGLWLALLFVQLIPLPVNWHDAMRLKVFAGNAGMAVSSSSIDLYSSQLYFAKACIFAVLFWLSVSLVNSRSKIELLAKVIVLSGLIQAIIGVVLMTMGATFQLFFVPMDDARAHGTFVSPDHFAGYLELTLAVGIGLMIAKLDGRSSVNWRKRLHGWLALLLSGKAMLRLTLIIMVVGLVASRSRMGNAAFFSSLLVVGLFAVIFSKHAARTTVIFITSLIVLDVVIIGGVVGVEKVVQRIQNTNLAEQVKASPTLGSAQNMANSQSAHVLTPEESVEQRSRAALASIRIVRDFPLMGTGGGTFHIAFPYYRPSEVQGFYDHAHNDFVEFASEVGLLGVTLLAALVLHSAWCSLRLLVNSRDQLARGMAFGSLMGMTSLLIHGTVDFNFQNTANAFLFIVVLSFPYLIKGLKH